LSRVVIKYASIPHRPKGLVCISSLVFRAPLLTYILLNMSDVTVDRLTCVALIPGVGTPYGYDPSLAAGIVFCVLYAISLLLHTFISIRYRVWWQLVFAVGALSKLHIIILPYSISNLLASGSSWLGGKVMELSMPVSDNSISDTDLYLDLSTCILHSRHLRHPRSFD
jgi:hypothetical protein